MRRPAGPTPSHSYEGRFLIAMPSLRDGPFARSVVYMCAHRADGAMGIVINQRAQDVQFAELLVQLDIVRQADAIRLPPSTQSTEAVRERLEQILHGVDPGAQIRQVEVIGPQVGGELQRSAVQGLLATLLLIFGYIALRFHTWRLSLGAILAVMHDPILVLGVFSLTRTTFDLTVVAAMLAVIGYSLNDTVVVFDRIRERFHGSRRLDPVLVLDQSINQTLSRTIMTKVVTLIVVVALYALGGPVLRGFSEALIIGILAGTYSSIYISSAVALDCGLTAEHLLPSAQKRPVDNMP